MKKERPRGTLLGVSAVPTRTRGVFAAGVLEVADVRAVIGPHSVAETRYPPSYGSTARCTRIASRLAERSPALSR